MPFSPDQQTGREAQYSLYSRSLPLYVSMIFASSPSTFPIQGFRHIIRTVIRLHLHIGLFRVHTERHVRGKRPGSRGPCQKVGILTLHLKTYNGRTLFYILIPLCHLMAGQRRTAAGTIRHNLISLYNSPFSQICFRAHHSDSIKES